ncbi:MAG: FAD-dependent oxidoreductase, partial [Pseudomonadota bacterium]|nr:FAD-dependent oxidoreductase [Pseudomonadota bacterium]
QVCRREQILRGFDDEVREFVAAEMKKKGVDIRSQTKLARLNPDGTAAPIQAVLTSGESIAADTVLFATGRAPNTAGLGLEGIGVELAMNGAVVVDENFRSSVSSVYAVGDVIDRVQLTPVALAEAMALVEHLFGDDVRKVDYMHIPTAVFTHPNIGTIGFSEQDARARFARIRVYRTDFKPLRHTLSGSSERTLMKLVVDDANDRVIGLHMVGADAGETIQGFAVAMKAGATKATFDATLGIHPTAAEELVTMRTPVVAS